MESFLYRGVLPVPSPRECLGFGCPSLSIELGSELMACMEQAGCAHMDWPLDVVMVGFVVSRQRGVDSAECVLGSIG